MLKRPLRLQRVLFAIVWQQYCSLSLHMLDQVCWATPGLHSFPL